MNRDVDLRQLAVQREAPTPPSAKGKRSHLVTRYLVPGGVLLGFAAVFAWAFRDSFLSSHAVTVVPVLTSRAAVQQSGAPMFHAAGWVEPRPTPVIVAALAEGFVDQLLVVEGQYVQAGSTVAKLIDRDARIALRASEAELAMREAERDTALAEIDVMIAQKQTDLADVPFQQRSADARYDLARWAFESRRDASGVIADITIRSSRQEWETAKAAVEQLKTRQERLTREIETLRVKRETSDKTAKARVEQARAAVDAARLRLERMVVKAPISGRVLSLVARPGMRLMGFTSGTPQDASTVISLYDPASLQVRADVRFEDLPRVLPGQPVWIETPSVSGKLDGVVLRLTSQANIQKNTLEVKVAVKDPPAALGADTLVTVTFLAPASREPKSAGQEALRILVPRQIVETTETGSAVWIADQAAGVARRRTIKVGPEMAGDLVEVVEGLRPGDRLISGGREGLRDGERITVTGEDASLGLGGREQGAKSNRPGRLPGAEGRPPNKP
jgi:RND family efflux transporter MFP subunit